jgi:hypothetical protein
MKLIAENIHLIFHGLNRNIFKTDFGIPLLLVFLQIYTSVNKVLSNKKTMLKISSKNILTRINYH